MERLQLSSELPYAIGALYSRQDHIHGRYGGQERGGISTPINSPFVFLFTGEAGEKYGYGDHWELEDGENIFHYFGEGQVGHMQYTRGNRAIGNHAANNKRLLVFQYMGKGQPYRFWGEFKSLYAYELDGIPDTKGDLRKAIVFKLVPVEGEFDPFHNAIADPAQGKVDISATSSLRLTDVRSKQSLFKRRLLTVEKQCRVTGIADLRFLRASHIKPWARCADGDERVDGSNGLLLSPHADFLFDRGWITFEDNGSLIRSDHLPGDVIDRIGLDLRQARKCGDFLGQQKAYLEYHRNEVFDQGFRKIEDPLSELFATALS